MHNESYYLGQIESINLELRNIEEAITQYQQNLDYLYEFQSQHNRMVNQLHEQIAARKNRYTRATLKAHEVRLFSQYSDNMDSFLNGTKIQHLYSQKEEEQYGIRTKIQHFENKLEALKQQRYHLEQELSDCYYLLRKERMNNEYA